MLLVHPIQFKIPLWSNSLRQHHRKVFHHGIPYGIWKLDASGFKVRKEILRRADPSPSGSRLLNVQTLRRFPKEKLRGECVLLRFDSNFLSQTSDCDDGQSTWLAISTIKYLYDLGAKVLIISEWGDAVSAGQIADRLSSILQVKVASKSIPFGFNQVEGEDGARIILFENLAGFKQESANCLEFARSLSAGTGIFVNDAFSVSHKALASTVGVTRFCYASIAGFKFEQDLSCAMEIADITRKPYFAIIGGHNFVEKSKALIRLASICDGLVFLGQIGHQIKHALRLSDSSNLTADTSGNEILELVQVAKNRKIPIFLPLDFLCTSNLQPEHLEIFPSDKLPTGWTPVGLGPRTLEEMFLMLSACGKILWIGPVEFAGSRKKNSGESELASMLGRLGTNGCEIITVGSSACNAIANIRVSSSSSKRFVNASSIWDFLKGKSLPGIAALDKAYAFDIDWNAAYLDQTLPLVVDIGSGNGLFLVKMARKWKSLNFLGLDINKRLVHRCLDYVSRCGIHNAHFLTANATHTFRSIISSYPSELILVSVQCPNPDFNNVRNRWRMVQRTLVEAIEDLLVDGGKVFLQSDVEDVAKRMKEEFIMFSKNIIIDNSYGEGWIKENPFAIRSDWERHVLNRGAPMYRIMLRKMGRSENNSSKSLDLICGAQTVNSYSS